MDGALTTDVGKQQKPLSRMRAFRRKLMPWSSCQVPKNFRAKPDEQFQMWSDLTAHLLAELAAVRDQDPVLAFERLMVVREVTRSVAPYGLEGTVEDPVSVIKVMPDFLRAIASIGSVHAAEHLQAALTHPSLDMSAVQPDLFSDLPYRDRMALLERLIALDRDSSEGTRLRLMMGHVILSEPDPDRLIGMIELAGQWDSLDAPTLLDRLIKAKRHVPYFPSLVLRVVSGMHPAQEPNDLLDRVLSFCQTIASDDVAQDIRFRIFEEVLSVPFARAWLENITAAEDAEVQEEYLLACVRRDERRGQALLFMLEWPSITDAVSLTRKYHGEMDDIGPEQLKDACDQLEDVAPDAALKLYRKSDSIRSAYNSWFSARRHGDITTSWAARPR